MAVLLPAAPASSSDRAVGPGQSKNTHSFSLLTHTGRETEETQEANSLKDRRRDCYSLYGANGKMLKIKVAYLC